jgi:hypothetical protein
VVGEKLLQRRGIIQRNLLVELLFDSSTCCCGCVVPVDDDYGVVGIGTLYRHR